MKNPVFKLLALCVVLGVPAGCVRDQVTGETRFSVVRWTPEEELKLGRENAPNVESLFDAKAPDSEANSVLGKLVGEMVSHSVRKADFDFHFKILNSSIPNAFALPGGFVYITRGLLQLMETEGQFISVLGHELGHVEHQHSMYNQSRGRITGVLTSPLRLGASLTRGLPGEGVVSLAAGVAASPLLLSGLRYNRGQELEADGRGVYFAAEMGYDPLEGVKTFRMFERLEKESNASWMTTELSLFRSHPLNNNRVDHIEKTAAKEYPELLKKPAEAFRADSPGFRATLERFKARAPGYAIYDEAVALMAKKEVTPAELEEAIKKLGEARSQLPDAPLLDIALGEAALRKDDSDGARKHFVAAVDLYDRLVPGDSHWKAHFYLGALHIEAKEGASAVTQLEIARERFPQQPAVHFLLAKAYQMTGDRGGAHAAYEKVIELTPSDSQLHRDARDGLRDS